MVISNNFGVDKTEWSVGLNIYKSLVNHCDKNIDYKNHFYP